MPQAEPDRTTVSRRRFCTAASAVVAGAGAATSAAIAAPITGAAEAAADENQALVAAGAEFDRLLQIERDLWNAIPDEAPESTWEPAEKAQLEVGKVADRIAHLPAFTPVGYRIKARVVAWCHGTFDGPVSIANQSSTTDIRIASSIVQDLLQNWEQPKIVDPNKPWRSQAMTPIHPDDRKALLPRDFEYAIYDFRKPIRAGCLIVITCSTDLPPGATAKYLRLARVLKADRNDNMVIAGLDGAPIEDVPSFGMVRVVGMQTSYV